MSVHNMKNILGEKSLLGMYRDCLKAVPLMNPHVSQCNDWARITVS